jgi:hypothetical protein
VGDPWTVYTVVSPKEVPRNTSFLRYPSRSKNDLFLSSAAQNIANLIDLEACPANLIWRSFGITTPYVDLASSSGAGTFQIVSLVRAACWFHATLGLFHAWEHAKLQLIAIN